MLNWKEIVQNYITKYSNRIQKATRPLHEHLGIDYFTYHRIDREGKYTVLVDRPDWAEYYVQEKFYLMDPYLRHPDVYESGTCVIGLHGSEEYKDEIFKAASKFDMTDCLMVIEKSDDAVEFFGYAGHRRNCNFSKLYGNHHPLLNAFSKHFKEQLGQILSLQEEEAHILPSTKGQDFYLPTFISPIIEGNSTQLFLKEIGMGNFCKMAERLTNREKECLEIMLEGKSSKEIAAQLSLSPRTIEFYLENIKDKIGCWNKSELFKKASQLQELGLL